MDTSIQARLKILKQGFERNRIIRYTKQYNQKEVFECIEAIGQMYVPKFKIDEYNRGSFTELTKYFFADETFAGDLHSGILLRGAPRTGKTLGLMIMNRIATFYTLGYCFDGVDYPFTFFIEDTGDVAKRYEDKGNIALKNGNTQRMYCLDDLGFENNFVKHYSNECNVVKEIISARDLYKKTHGFITAATTNYMYEVGEKRVFKELYGERIELRMKGMFSEIVFKGKARI